MSQTKFIFENGKVKNVPLDYEEDFLTSSCLPVPKDVQFKDIPMDGLEYVLKGMKEREKLASVLKCDYEKLTKKLVAPKANMKIIINPVAPDSIKPTIEWQNIQVADFSDVRMYIQKMLAKDLLPTAIKDIELSKHRVKDWEPLFNEEPTMTHVVGLSQSVLDEGLELLIEQLDSVKPGQSIDCKTGRWIYTLLAVTRDSHLHNTAGILRDLARKCGEIRNGINPEEPNLDEVLAPLNLFICLVARYFQQTDLAD